ncbi:MAG: hypothetical protein EOP38_02425 [Rubrivivax sp.]|nr:MAG: hypothetical protein EOP38_02425 [Rubrivivax sp.]
MRRARGRLHGAVIPLLILLVFGGLSTWKIAQDDSRTDTLASVPAGPAQPVGGAALAASAAGLDPMGQARQAQRRALTEQLAAAQHRLDSYREATRYPPESQAISRHGDQLKPFEPVVENRPALNAQGEPVAGRHLQSSQDRVHVSGQDSVVFTLRVQDDQGYTAPLRVIRATAHEVQDVAHPQTVTQTALLFDDRGANGDARASDGVHSARLQPAAQGFATTQGTIRVDVDYQSDTGGVAHTFFDIVYMPNVPATWSGAVRESMNQGSLDFYLKAQVREAGRYVITARAYDATGKAFALLSFNDEVPAGATEFKLTLFGKLVRDAKPVFPITLRDIEGFVLYPDRFPDRAMMPRWPRVAYTSANHAITEFADAEWDSEVRQRYLAEYAKDVDQARRSLQPLTP